MAKKEKAQITKWVILGVILVGSIILFFSINREAEITSPEEQTAIFDMQSFLDQCTSNHVYDALNILLPQGGFLENQNSALYNGAPVEYMCDNLGVYVAPPLFTCVNQHPMLMEEVKQEIHSYLLNGRLQTCLEEMQREFNSRGEIRLDNPSQEPELEITWNPDNIKLIIKKGVTIEKQGETRRFEDIRVNIGSPAYNLVDIARIITLQEAETCNFEYVGHGIFYRRYNVEVYRMSDSTKIYTIEDRESQEKMNIAIRGCAIPYGLG